MPQISLCMIVRDERQFVDDCLDSVEGVVHEVVVVDTGSVDGTLEKLRPRVDRLIELPWSHDFAAARNASLDAATGDWILVLDADERLRSGSQMPLHDATEDPRALAWRLRLESRTARGQETVLLTRLFRRHPRVRYEGRVHEQVTPALWRLMQEDPRWRCDVLDGVTIDHLGYDPAHQPQEPKNRRNLELLLQMVHEEPENAYVHYKLFLQLGKHREGLGHLQRAAKLVLSMPEQERQRCEFAAELLTNACLLWIELGENSLAATTAEWTLRNYPDHPATRLTLALALARLGKVERACRQLERARTTPDPANGFAFDRTALQATVESFCAAHDA